MKNVEKLPLLFYQKMGELFYAIAAADKVVRKVEYDVLKKMVLEKWKDLDDSKDPFQTDAAHQIEIVFDWFDYEQLEANNCFDSFEDYKKENSKLFTQERKQLIWETADAIASSFAGKNKSELIMLAKLKILLND
ncbi:hypothetical protein [Aequorivita capsosiphonis]|uniref:hypothetical protein n=1 Tax=Aequorivita capsosiphonis TaxID=487317 RepID=UPI0004020F10|nr:hypothetical protein [Aequorivita capsosiphonis]